MNKCLILVRHMTFMGKNDEWHADQTLADVHERADYANFYELHSNGSIDLTCDVGATKCKSLDDFRKLIEAYMNN